mmetsp:Transcript_33892/g.89183  ORF Transcript_33892/g.89183 Transcript_33892/m.89183 type:complete len:187 (-) Transcript_33892:192-752(-)
MAQPQRAATALAVALLAAGLLYAVVGFALAWLYEHAHEGVQPLIILNLPHDSAFGLVVNWCTALVALLSYPLPLMPVVQLLKPRTSASGRSSDPRGETYLRLFLLLLTTFLTLAVPNFESFAGFLGCLNIAFAQVLPPLVHLRLRSLRLPSGVGKWALVLVDTFMALLGLATLLYFSILTGSSLLA